MTPERTWWPAGAPEVGDRLAEDLAAAAMPTLMSEIYAVLAPTSFSAPT